MPLPAAPSTVVEDVDTLTAARWNSNNSLWYTALANYVVFKDVASQVVTKSLTLTPDSGVALTATTGGITITAGGLTVTAGGATITAGNVALTAGNLTFGAASAKIIPGATSLLFRDNGDANTNLSITDAGAVTVRAGLTVTAGGLTVSSGTTAVQAITSGAITVTGAKITAAATAAGYASLNLPHGTAPSSPSNGDVWTTTGGLYARVNGTTVGPVLGSGAAGSLTTLALTGTGPVIDGSSGTFTATPALKFPSAADVAISLRAGSGSFASGGSSTISWSTEQADTKSLSSVGGGATTTAFNTGAYGGLWIVSVAVDAPYSSGSETGSFVLTGSIANHNLLFPNTIGTTSEGSSHFTFYCRIADSTNVSLTIQSAGGTNGLSWSGVQLTAFRLW